MGCPLDLLAHGEPIDGLPAGDAGTVQGIVSREAEMTIGLGIALVLVIAFVLLKSRSKESPRVAPAFQ